MVNLPNHSIYFSTIFLSFHCLTQSRRSFMRILTPFMNYSCDSVFYLLNLYKWLLETWHYRLRIITKQQKTSEEISRPTRLFLYYSNDGIIYLCLHSKFVFALKNLSTKSSNDELNNEQCKRKIRFAFKNPKIWNENESLATKQITATIDWLKRNQMFYIIFSSSMFPLRPSTDFNF